MPKIIDPDSIAQTTDIVFDTSARTIQVLSTGAISATGASRDNGITMQCLYSFSKEEWRTDTTLIKFPFPLISITAESFELVNGWDFLDDSSRELVRDAGWALKDAGGVSLEEYMNVATLGNFDNSGTDQAYYLQVTGGTPTDTVTAGEVNQPVKIFGDATHGNFDYRDLFIMYLREQGKLYGQYDLLTEQGLSAVTYQKYALPLSNGTDLKITVADTGIDSDSNGTADVAPYDDMNITYLSGNNFYTTDQGTYAVDDVVQDGAGRWYICTGAGTTDATDYADLGTMAGAGTATFIAYSGERLIGSTYYAYRVIVDANVDNTGENPTAEQIYEFVQFSLRQTLDIDAGAGTERGDIADDLLAFVGDTLITKEGVYVDDFNASDTNRITLTDVSGSANTFPFVAAGVIFFNDNLQNDTNAVYRIFFTNDDAGDDAGDDYATTGAITIQDNSSVDIEGNVSAQPSVSFDFDYDGNIQRGAASAGTDAPYTAVAIGLDTAQYVITTGTIARSTSNSVNFVSSLERNYLNPA